MNPRPESALAEAVTSGEVTPVPATNGAEPARLPVSETPATNRRWRTRPRVSGDSVSHPGLDDAARLRLGLQRRAQTNLRRHVRRDLVRVGVLVSGDLTVFWLMRGAIRAIRDHGMLGEASARVMAELLPRGILSGTQFALALLLALFVTGNYGEGDARRDPGQLLRASALATALPLWSRLWNEPPELVLVWYACTVAVIWMALLVERMTIDRIVAIVRPPDRDALATILVGRSGDVHETVRMAAFQAKGEFVSIGHVEAHAGTPTNGAMGGLEDLRRLINETRAEAVVICSTLSERSFETVVDAALSGGCELVALPRTIKISGVRPTLVWRGGEPMVTLTAPALKAGQLAVKRVVDVFGALVGLLLLSPVLLTVAALIKLDSRGPILFRQQRVGLGGRVFGMFKFRTMVADADRRKAGLAHLNQTGDPRLFKIQNDPRITRVGTFLRRWSVDEVPQLLNVLAGDMSMIGPRPFFLADLEQYEAHHFDRLGAKPGMTGLWQVSGRSTVVDFEEVVRLDREYIEKWSLGLDFKILAMTVPAVLRRTGAF